MNVEVFFWSSVLFSWAFAVFVDSDIGVNTRREKDKNIPAGAEV